MREGTHHLILTQNYELKFICLVVFAYLTNERLGIAHARRLGKPRR